MAIYPCCYGEHRYAGAQQSVYVTEVTGGEIRTYSMRLCPTHFDLVEALIVERMVRLDADAEAPRGCEVCGEGREVLLSAKIFASKSDVEEFVVDLCAEHARDLGDALPYRSGRALTPR